MINSKLVYSHICSKNLTQSSIERMYCIMEQNYSSISFLSFKNDLKNKQFIGLLEDIDNQIQGFTTYAINPFGLGNSEYNILFIGKKY